MLHFTEAEFDERMARTRAEMEARGLDAMLLFAPESQYWLTGYDTFGYCFFQCLVVTLQQTVLLTRSADLRQAQLTSTVKDIRIWTDRAGHDPSADLERVLRSLRLTGRRIGWETATQGLTYANGAKVGLRIGGMAELVDASDMMGRLRLVKSPAEIAYVREAAALSDAAFEAALAEIRPGSNEGHVFAAMHDAVFRGGGDYPGNGFIIGSGEHALLCRTQSGRRVFGEMDQVNLEWAGSSRHYHAANFKTVILGAPRPEHLFMQEAAFDALLACEAALRPGHPMAEVFDAHARVLDAAGLSQHRLNACGYALGPRFAPSWMEDQMFYEGAPAIMEPGMVFFLHMILMDSDSGSAMCLGRTSLVTEAGAEPLGRMPLEMVVV
jgi:Xaa-Pro dipeptidase